MFPGAGLAGGVEADTAGNRARSSLKALLETFFTSTNATPKVCWAQSFSLVKLSGRRTHRVSLRGQVILSTEIAPAAFASRKA